MLEWNERTKKRDWTGIGLPSVMTVSHQPVSGHVLNAKCNPKILQIAKNWISTHWDLAEGCMAWSILMVEALSSCGSISSWQLVLSFSANCGCDALCRRSARNGTLGNFEHIVSVIGSSVASTSHTFVRPWCLLTMCMVLLVWLASIANEKACDSSKNLFVLLLVELIVRKKFDW